MGLKSKGFIRETPQRRKWEGSWRCLGELLDNAAGLTTSEERGKEGRLGGKKQYNAVPFQESFSKASEELWSLNRLSMESRVSWERTCLGIAVVLSQRLGVNVGMDPKHSWRGSWSVTLKLEIRQAHPHGFHRATGAVLIPFQIPSETTHRNFLKWHN